MAVAAGSLGCSARTPESYRTQLDGPDSRSTLGFSAQEVSGLGYYRGSLDWVGCGSDVDHRDGMTWDLFFSLTLAEGSIYEVEPCGGEYIGNADCRSYVELPVSFAANLGPEVSDTSAMAGVVRAFEVDVWRLYVRTNAVEEDLRCPLGPSSYSWFDGYQERGDIDGNYGATWVRQQGSSGTAGGFVAATWAASYLGSEPASD